MSDRTTSLGDQVEEKNLRDELLLLQTEDRLKTMTVLQLRAVLKKLTRSTKGTKQELLSRVIEFLQSRDFSSLQEENVAEENVAVKRQVETKVTERSAKRFAMTTAVKVEAASRNYWTLLRHRKPKPDWIAYDPCTMRPPPSAIGSNAVKVISWNVNGLRACLKRKNEGDQDGSALARLAEVEKFDIICLQETKLQVKDVETIKNQLLGDYSNSFWTCSTSKLGYSGSALISRIKPLSVTYGLGISDHDGEGRLVTAEFDAFYLVSVYVPNSGQKLERLAYRTKEWDPALSSYLSELQKRKPVVVTGDLNCAHQEIDIHDPVGNKKNAGFTDEERNSFRDNFLNQGLVDTFRRQHPFAVGFTYWSYRSNSRPQNKGWRLDYFLVSEKLAEFVLDSYVLPHVNSSDHCPVGLILKM